MGTAVAVIALAIAAVLTWKHKMPKIVALLTLVAGSGLQTGWVGRMLGAGVDAVAALVGSATSAAFGVAVPAVVAVVAFIVYVHDMWPRHSAGRVTAGIGLLLPTLIEYLGGAAGSLSGSGVDMVGNAVGRALGALFGGGGA